MQPKCCACLVDLCVDRDLTEKEKSKLVLESQQLSLDLDTARENLALKNKELLRLQERVLSLEAELRGAGTEVKLASSALESGRLNWDKLERR